MRGVEFVIGLSSSITQTMEEKVKTLFETYDVDGSGTISTAEFVQLVHGGRHKLTEIAKYVENYFAMLDQDGDQSVTEDEFVHGAQQEPLVLQAIQRHVNTISIHKTRTVQQDVSSLCIDRLHLDWPTLLTLHAKFWDKCPPPTSSASPASEPTPKLVRFP